MVAFLNDDTLERHVSGVLAAHPEQEPVIRAFLPLLRTRNRLLRESVEQGPDEQVNERDSEWGVWQAVRDAVAEGLPTFGTVALAELTRLDPVQVARLLHGETEPPAEPLTFVLGQTRRVLAAMATANLPEAPDTQTLRACPYCQGQPELSVIHTSEGQRSLVCGWCGRSWRFRRLTCPACGLEEAGNLHSLHAEGRPEERGVHCTACNHYLLEVDIRHLDLQPEQSHVLALGLGSLDVLMQTRGKLPLSQSTGA